MQAGEFHTLGQFPFGVGDFGNLALRKFASIGIARQQALRCVFTHGGRKPAGLDAVEWAQEAVRRGAGELLVTSMDTDGHKSGYDIAMLRAISEAVTVPVIASGGAGGPAHMAEALTTGRADAVLAASIFHFGTYSIRQVKEYLAAEGIPVRLDATSGFGPLAAIS